MKATRPPALDRAARAGTDPGPGLAVWNRIVDELGRLQDGAPPDSPGSVVNPICGRPYILDTCCAAKVFAAEYRRTGARQWQERAEQAVAAAQAARPLSGIVEPTWNALGWHDAPDSLPPTAMAVEAYWDALGFLGVAAETTPVTPLLDFLGRCRKKNGGFAHNAVRTGPEPADVQNATASALRLIGRLARNPEAETHPVYAGLTATASQLLSGQTASGFWPYRHPGSRLRERLRRIPGVWRFVSYDAHGDVMHHLMTLYFASGCTWPSGDAAAAAMLRAGWRWIQQRLRQDPDGRQWIEWEGDPVPPSPGYSNARDTNAYFLLLGTIPRLAARGIVDSGESRSMADGLLAHVAGHLMAEPERTPCVTPHEGPSEIVGNILPMFEQSVAWKGSLLSETILDQGTAA